MNNMYRVEITTDGQTSLHSSFDSYRDAIDQADMVHGEVYVINSFGDAISNKDCWRYACDEQGYNETYLSWCCLDDDERSEYESGANGGSLTATEVIDKDLLETIKGVHLDYSSNVREKHLDALQSFIEQWIYESTSVTIDTWRIQEEYMEGASIEQAQRQAVVELGHLRFLESHPDLQSSLEHVAASPVS